MKNIRYSAEACLLSFLILGLTGCSSYTLYQTASLPPDFKIMIDGKTEDWLSTLSILEDGSVSVGFLNDQENLYVCLIAESGPLQDQIMMQGLTVWFDPQGGTAKAFGIKYPLGVPPGERPMPPQEERERASFEDFSEKTLSELEIIKSKKEAPQKMEIAEAKGIEVKAVPTSERIVYELKIPLLQTDQHPFAVGVQPGKTIGVGFETGKLNLDKAPGRPPGGMPGGGGGMPPMGGGFGPSGAGGRGGFGMRPEMPKGLKIWAQVQLSSGKSATIVELLSVSRIFE